MNEKFFILGVVIGMLIALYIITWLICKDEILKKENRKFEIFFFCFLVVPMTIALIGEYIFYLFFAGR